MRTFLSFYRMLFVLLFVMCALGVGCSDDSEKPKVESDVGVDASVDVDSDVDSSLGDVQEVEDVAQDASLSDVGDKLATGEECPESCVVDDMGMRRCNACVGDWCVLDQFTLAGEMPYCTQSCVSNVECDVYGAEWACSDFYGFCLKTK